MASAMYSCIQYIAVVADLTISMPFNGPETPKALPIGQSGSQPNTWFLAPTETH